MTRRTNTHFRVQRALHLSLSMLALALPLAASAQIHSVPPADPGGNHVPVSTSGAPATSAGPSNSAGSSGQATPTTAGTPATAPVSSSAVIKLKKEIQGGDYAYQFVSANGDTALTAVMPLPGATGTDVLVGVPSNVDAKTAKLDVLDNTRGNLARFAIKTNAPISLTDSSFNYAQRINVPVQKGGLGVIGAQVTLTDASKTYNKTTTLQSSDTGLARFDNVPLGKELTATVSYGDHQIRVSQTLPLSRTGDGWSPMIVDWADVKTMPAPVPVAVVGSKGPAPLPQGESAESGYRRDRSDTQSNASPFAGVLSTLVGLIFLACISYCLYWLYQTGRLKNVLDKLGINAAVMATNTGTAQPSPFDKPAKPPIQPITDGTADPFGGIGMAPVGMGVAPAAVVSGPRLVATMGTYAGSIFPLMGPSTDIGRDAGNPIPLPNDTNTSRRHATLQMTNGQVVVVDNGSSNGTYVNGVRIASQAPQPLRSGDEVTVGNTRFRFEA